jgi:hypothetical protein
MVNFIGSVLANVWMSGIMISIVFNELFLTGALSNS